MLRKNIVTTTVTAIYSTPSSGLYIGCGGGGVAAQDLEKTVNIITFSSSSIKIMNNNNFKGDENFYIYLGGGTA